MIAASCCCSAITFYFSPSWVTHSLKCLFPSHSSHSTLFLSCLQYLVWQHAPAVQVPLLYCPGSWHWCTPIQLLLPRWLLSSGLVKYTLCMKCHLPDHISVVTYRNCTRALWSMDLSGLLPAPYCCIFLLFPAWLISCLISSPFVNLSVTVSLSFCIHSGFPPCVLLCHFLLQDISETTHTLLYAKKVVLTPLPDHGKRPMCSLIYFPHVPEVSSYHPLTPFLLV